MISSRFRLSIGAAISLALLGSQIGNAMLPDQYQTMSALQKQAILWDKIRATEYQNSSLPTVDPGLFSIGKLLLSNFLWTTFTYTSDEMPVGRPKLIHTYGSVGEVEFHVNAASSNYTGLFKTGGIGLARLSLAKQSGAFTPGMALKIFVDGRPSVNFQVMYSLDGQGENRNFFENKFTNVIAGPQSFVLKLLGSAFEYAVKTLSKDASQRPESATALPIIEAAEVFSDGLTVESSEVIAPYEIVFTPNPEVKELLSKELDQDFRIGFQKIPAGTVLYSVCAKKSKDASEEYIGELVLKSALIASEYGDAQLFFQHPSKSAE